jgi:signal transduction histidine kinase
LFHPISVFVILQISWVTITVLWVIWFVGQREELARIAQGIGRRQYPESTWGITVLIIGVALLVLTSVGTVMLFIWGQKQTSFIQQQQQFVSSVTHELRTPLASLHLAYETMTRRTLDEEKKSRLLSMSLIDIERLIRLVNQILISSRLDRGLAMFRDDVAEFSFNGRVRELIKGLAHLDSQLEVRLKLLEDCDVHMSATAFNLILSNLIENAVKYSPPRSPIFVTCRVDGKNMLFQVEDQGMGLDRREKRKIFKMFYRGEKATRGAIPGTGLGLFIVRTAVEQLGGTLQVASDGPGQGSVFKVDLPVRSQPSSYQTA